MNTSRILPRVRNNAPPLQPMTPGPPYEPERLPPITYYREPSWTYVLANVFGSLLAAMFGAAIIIVCAFMMAGVSR